MEANVNEVTINGIIYVQKGTTQEPAPKLDGMPYCLIRTTSAGVFTGYLKSRKDKEVELVNAIRLWYWSGAASLSQIALDGVAKPKECKFAKPLPSIILTEAIEIIPCSNKAKQSIEGVPTWQI